jgi:hypothetical protein
MGEAQITQPHLVQELSVGSAVCPLPFLSAWQVARQPLSFYEWQFLCYCRISCQSPFLYTQDRNKSVKSVGHSTRHTTPVTPM